MYKIAQIDPAKCSATNCRLCTLYCPEPNALLYDEERKTAFVAIDRCKGCSICLSICADIAKRNCIKMIPVEEAQGAFEMSKYGLSWHRSVACPQFADCLKSPESPEGK